MKIKQNYNHTLYACYIGYITQAIINNFVPLLFLTFQKEYQIPLKQIALLVTANFGIQLIVDMISAKFVDKIGYRKAIVGAHICCTIGLIGLSIFPKVCFNSYYGLLLAITFYAAGGGVIEVLISPIVEACPTSKKEAAMSLLHSFYCWGHVFVVICSTIYFSVIGTKYWPILACLWAMIPLFNSIYFQKVPINMLVEEHEGMSVKKLVHMKVFWILILLMICAGACEQAMSQWASAFAESGLKVSKTIGDLAGPCMFAIFMGSARAFYAKYSEKIKLQSFMTISTILCIISYLLASLSNHPIVGLIGCALCGLSVGILWPGTFSIASKYLRAGGTALFALLALAGDIGCSVGPTLVGRVSGFFQDDLKKGLFAALLFPILLLVGLIWCKKQIQ